MLLSKKKDLDPTDGALFPSIIAFSIPVILSNIFAAFYHSADIMILSEFSKGNEVASVGASTSVVSLLLSVAIGLGTGGTVILSRLFGRKEADRVQDTLSTMLIFALVIGAALGLFGIFLMRPLLLWTNCPAECLADATLYSVVYILGMPFYLLYNYAAGAIRVGGDSKNPLYFMLIGGGANILLNILFCFVFSRAVLAVALATVLSNALSAALCVRLMIKNNGICHWDPKKIRMDFSVVKQMIRYGLPTAIAASLYPISNLQMQSAINGFGPSAIAGNTASIQYENICSNIGNGLNTAAATFIGQNMGAGKKDRVLRSFFTVAITEFVTMLVLSAAILAFARPLLPVFVGSDAAAIEIGVLRLSYVMSIYSIVMNPCATAITTMGYPTLQTAISLTGICGLRTVWMQLLYDTSLLPASIENVYLCFPFSVILTQLTYAIVIAVLLVRYKKGTLKDTV